MAELSGQPQEGQWIARYRFVVSFEAPRFKDYPDSESWLANVEPRMAEEIGRAIRDDFSGRVDFIFGGMVSARLESIERGSILGSVILVLSAGVSLFEFLSLYKDFYESLILLRQQLRSLIDRIVGSRVREPDVFHRVDIVMTQGSILLPNSRTTRRVTSERYPNAFFWYLFGMNILLLVIIAVLVYRAVAIVYLKQP